MNRSSILFFTISLFVVAWLNTGCSSPVRAELSDKEIAFVADKIFQNECGGNEMALVSWNRGEAFPSLGIGHFIWYPQDVRGPFTESFPALLAFAEKEGKALPAGLSPRISAPWSSREQFLAQLHSPLTTAIRNWLKSTRDIQAKFIIRRFNRAVPRLLEHTPPSEQKHVAARIQALLASAQGAYALIDYTNFKGEGINPGERYRNQGWGLLQVLQGMADGTDILNAFADSAAAVLERRIENSPPEWGEKRWRAGWLSRIDSYRPA